MDFLNIKNQFILEKGFYGFIENPWFMQFSKMVKLYFFSQEITLN